MLINACSSIHIHQQGKRSRQEAEDDEAIYRSATTGEDADSESDSEAQRFIAAPQKQSEVQRLIEVAQQRPRQANHHRHQDPEDEAFDSAEYNDVLTRNTNKFNKLSACYNVAATPEENLQQALGYVPTFFHLKKFITRESEMDFNQNICRRFCEELKVPEAKRRQWWDLVRAPVAQALKQKRNASIRDIKEAFMSEYKARCVCVFSVPIYTHTHCGFSFVFPFYQC